MNKKKTQNTLFFIALYLFVFFIFQKAFSIAFFQDDFFFLKISRAETIADFLRFFSPIRTYSYKPLASEVFYFIIHLLGNNVIAGHAIVFIIYSIGLYYLYQILKIVTHNDLLSKLTIFLYAIHFTHVFQLYWFAAFQEIALFTFLSISFYHFFIGKKIISFIFFIFALLSKETAIFFFPFLLLASLLCIKNLSIKEKVSRLIPYAFLAIFFSFVYKYSLHHVTALENYTLHFSPKFLLNNFVWYFLWSIGYPNFMPLYLTSLFKPPIAQFWQLFAIKDIKIYFIFFALYSVIFLIMFVTFILKNPVRTKKIVAYFLISLMCFFIFIAPLLLFMHKWMVRLAVPLIFVSFFQAYILVCLLKRKRLWRKISILLIILYIIMNYYGVKVHESSSLYLLETRFVTSADRYFSKNKNEILTHRYLYFQDPPQGASNPWGGSKKLKNTFSDQAFLDYFFPHSRLTAVYGFENSSIPKEVFVLQASDILTNEQMK